MDWSRLARDPHLRLDDLQLDGFHLWQDDRLFCFSVDAVLLADFATVRRGDKVCDLCSGNGIIPVLLCANTQAAHIDGVELLEQSWDLARHSVAFNHLEDKIAMHHADLRQLQALFPPHAHQVVTCNPPFGEMGGGVPNMSREQYVARHEAECTLEDIVRQAAYLLSFRGRFALIHRPERLCDIICLMRQYGVEPKRLRMVHPRPGQRPAMVLVEGSLGGGAQLCVEPPLYIHDAQGRTTPEAERMYHRCT